MLFLDDLIIAQILFVKGRQGFYLETKTICEGLGVGNGSMGLSVGGYYFIFSCQLTNKPEVSQTWTEAVGRLVLGRKCLFKAV